MEKGGKPLSFYRIKGFNERKIVTDYTIMGVMHYYRTFIGGSKHRTNINHNIAFMMCYQQYHGVIPHLLLNI